MDERRSTPRRSRVGIQLGATLVAASVVAVALTTGAFLFWLTVRTSLYDGLQAGAEQDADAVASQLEEGGASSIGDLDDDRLVQVVDSDGAVVVVSEGAPRTPIAARDDAAAELRLDGVTYVTAVEDVDGGSYVVAGRSAESAEATLATVGTLLVVAVPLLVGLVALTAWIGVGRALSPVERMRRQVEGVTAATLAGRIDEPATGDEIARLARTLNDMLDRLDAAHENQRRFVSDASHELKSPLAAMRQYAEVARDHPDRISGRELSEAVLEEGERLDRLVQGMLVLAQLDEGVLRVEAGDVDLDDLLFEEARRVRETAALSVDTSGVVRRQGPRRCRLAPPTGAEPRRQRGQARAASRRILAADCGVGGDRGAGGARRRRRHPGGRTCPRLRAVRAAGRRACTRHGRQRPGPRDRAGDRRSTRRVRADRGVPVGWGVRGRHAAGGSGGPLITTRNRIRFRLASATEAHAGRIELE